MSESNAAASPSPFRLVATLAGIALFSGVLLSLTYEGTKPIIAQKEQAALQAAVMEVLPGAVSQRPCTVDETGLVVLSKGAEGGNAYEGLDVDGNRIGFALTGEARGYADVIRILYGFDPARKQVIGMKVLSSNETPGLGDKIEKDPVFQENFTALDASLAEPIETVKNGEKEHPWQVDGISGATVSSKAVGKALRESTSKWVPLILQALEAEEGQP